jgi:hypothetical protein
VGALAEGLTPPCVVLTRVPEDEDWRRTADEVADSHASRPARLAARSATPGVERQRETMLRAYADTLSSLPCEPAHLLLAPPRWRPHLGRARGCRDVSIPP